MIESFVLVMVMHMLNMTESLVEKRRMLIEAVVGNDDLLLEILLRLPAESLYRFKCVSKHWRSLISFVISDPKSCFNHTRMNPKSSILGVYYYFHRWETHLRVQSVSLRRDDQSLPTLAFLYHVYNSTPVIVHASKGLFLCSFGEGKPFAVCNLTTQKFNRLPQHLPCSTFDDEDLRSAYLDFDPIKSIHYKVVLVVLLDKVEDINDLDGPCYEIDIYSSESKTWKRKHFRSSWGCDFQYKALWNGGIHWMTDWHFHIRFQIDTEILIASHLPPHPKILEDLDICYFGECCGRLFLIEIERHDCEDFYILEMDNGFTWTMKYSVNMMPLRTYFDEIFKSPDPMGYVCKDHISWKFSVLCIVKEDEKNDFALLLALPGKILLYNLKSATFKVLREFLTTDFFLDYIYNYAVAFPFIPTLSPT